MHKRKAWEGLLELIAFGRKNLWNVHLNKSALRRRTSWKSLVGASRTEGSSDDAWHNQSMHLQAKSLQRRLRCFRVSLLRWNIDSIPVHQTCIWLVSPWTSAKLSCHFHSDSCWYSSSWRTICHIARKAWTPRRCWLHHRFHNLFVSGSLACKRCNERQSAKFFDSVVNNAHRHRQKSDQKAAK